MGTMARAGEDYLDLVRECPLRIIRSEPEYEHAIATLDRLSDRGSERTPDETEYLLALALFVEKYEREHDPIPRATGVEMLQYLIETHGVMQSEVASATGLSDSTISEILAGKRKLNLKHIEALARFFKVEPAFFLGRLRAVPILGSSMSNHHHLCPDTTYGIDVGLDAAGDHVADAPAFGQAAAEVAGGDADRRDRDRDQGCVPWAEVGQPGRVDFLDARPVHDDDRRQLRDPLAARATWGGPPGCRRRSGRRARRRDGRGGRPPASRRCNAGRGAWPRCPRPRMPGGRRSRSATISRRWPTAVRPPGLCGGEPATTSQTRSSPQASRHCSARIRCPRWIGSNVPPNRPSRIDRTSPQLFPDRHIPPLATRPRADFRVDKRAEIGCTDGSLASSGPVRPVTERSIGMACERAVRTANPTIGRGHRALSTRSAEASGRNPRIPFSVDRNHVRIRVY